jgi:hypothetical protein
MDEKESICIIDGCTRPKVILKKGLLYSFCGREHAEEFARLQLLTFESVSFC